MAGLGFEIPDDYLRDFLDKNFDDFAPEMLNDVLPILDTSIKRHLSSKIKDGTGELISSIKDTKPKKTNTDAWICNVHISGYSKKTYRKRSRAYPVSNALKAIWLNYGNAHQPARPWLSDAVSSCQAEILQKLQTKWEQIIGANK